jgi:chromosomal replication initiator protein
MEQTPRTNEPLDNKQLWENVLVDIELNISKANFNTWFKDTHIIKQEEGIVYLGVPNQFVRDWLSQKYHKFILRALRTFSENIRGVEYVVSKSTRDQKKQESAGSERQQVNELPLENYYINKNDNLNPRYTFDTFVVGPFNELAHAAAQAIVKKPGIAYNPLFVYGGTGHGKTHLIQAIGNQLKKINSDKKVYYVTSERFTVDYINALQNQKANSFKEKYRQYDVFIMDDIQFLSKKEMTQEELFHLFNTLYDNNKQIVFSSDQHPSYIPEMEERLKSRFSAGMIVDISAPDRESREAILKSKASHFNFQLSDEIIDYLATTIEGNIRDLEGTLNTIICQSQLMDRPLSLSEVENLIKDSAKPKKTTSINDVIEKIAEFYEIDKSSIYEKTRRKEVVKPRQLIMFVLREDLGVSYPTIGQKLGGRDHTTVIHSCEKVKNDLKHDSILSQELNQIRMLLK